MKRAERAVLVIESTGADSWSSMKSAVEQLSIAHRIIQASSTYELDREVVKGGASLAGGRSLVGAILCDTHLGPREFCEDIDFRTKAFSGVKVSLLGYGDVFKMTPQVTIPHPELHEKAHWLHVAAELWPDYQHPVFNENLGELARRFPSKEWGHFHAQGKALIDF